MKVSISFVTELQENVYFPCSVISLRVMLCPSKPTVVPLPLISRTCVGKAGESVGEPFSSGTIPYLDAVE